MSKALVASSEQPYSWPVFKADGTHKANGWIDGRQNIAITSTDTSNISKTIKHTWFDRYHFHSWSNTNNKFEIKGFDHFRSAMSKTWNDFYTSTGRKTFDLSNVIAFYTEANAQVLHLLIKLGNTYYDAYEYSSDIRLTNWISENTFTVHSDFQVVPKVAKFTPGVKAYVYHTGTQIKILKFADGTNHLNRLSTAPSATYTLDHIAPDVTDMIVDDFLQTIVVFKNSGYDVIKVNSIDSTTNVVSASVSKGTDARLTSIRKAIVLNVPYSLIVYFDAGTYFNAHQIQLNQQPDIDLEITLIAAGGGGGAGFQNSSNYQAGGGGGGGEIKTVRVTVKSGTYINCTVGWGGVGGLSTGGGNGDNTSVVVNRTTYTATGGKGASNGHGGNSGNNQIATDRGTTGTYRDGGDGAGANTDPSTIGQGIALDLHPYDGTNDTQVANGYGAGGKGGTRLAGRSGDQSSTPGSNQQDGSDALSNSGCGGGGGNNGGGTNAIGAGGNGGSGLIAIKYLNSIAKIEGTDVNVHNDHFIKLVKNSGLVTIP